MTSLTVGSEGEAWLQQLIPDLLESKQLESIVAFTDGHILRDVPEIDTRTLRADLHASSLALGRTMLPSLATGLTPDELPDEAHALAESITHSGMDLRVLLRIYRSGQQAMIATLTDEVGRTALDPTATRELVAHAAACVADWAGTAVETLSATFAAHHDPDLPGRFARRRETVHALIAGAPIDAATAQRRLGYALDDTHLALVLWLDDDVRAGQGDLERVAQRIAAHLGARGSFTLRCGERSAWAWLHTTSRATVEIAAIAAAESVRVAVGLPAPGVQGFRRSHREALAAREIQRTTARSGRVVLYDSVELDHLISQDSEAMRAFLGRELNGLLGSGANVTRLRETLCCYLDLMCSIEATARELGVHRHTVRYRLERIEQLLGHGLDSGRLKLALALHCAASLGIDTVQPDPPPSH